LFDTLCAFTNLAAKTAFDDESIMYKVLVLIKQDVVNFWDQLGCEYSGTRWLALMYDLRRALVKNGLEKINREIDSTIKEANNAYDSIQNAEGMEACDCWNEYIRLNRLRKDVLVPKKKYLLSLQ
jgi:hypothetical protein